MPGDPGLQPERTALAWHRTGVATLLAGGVAAAAAVRRGGPLAVGAALVALALAAVTAVPPGSPRAHPPRPPLAHGRRSPLAYPPGRRQGPPPTAPYPRLVRAAVATVALAAVGVLLALG